MTSQNPSPKAIARAAGILYLTIVVAGVAGGALRSQLGPAEFGFRLSVLADVVMALADVGVGVLLFFLLRPVSQALALMAMAFRLAQAACIGLNLLNLVLAAELAATGDALSATFLGAHAIGYDLSLFFFAVNCFLTGVLVFRAEFLPRSLGVAVGVSGVVYLIGSVARVVAPAGAELVALAYVLPLVAELAFAGYLITRGLDLARWRAVEPGMAAA